MRAVALVCLLVGILGACGLDSSQPQPTARGLESPARALDSLPGLVEVPLEIQEHPWGPVSIALSQSGVMAYLFGQDGPPYLTLVDPSGKTVGRFGPEGEGPGELSGAGTVLFDGEAFLVLDTRRGSAVRFSAVDGSYLSESRYLSNGIPLAAVPDSVDEFEAEYAMRGVPAEVARVALKGAGRRSIVSESDSVFREILQRGGGKGRLSGPMPYAADGRAVLWADGVTYTVRKHQVGIPEMITAGRQLPPNFRGPLSARLQREALERAVSLPVRSQGGMTIADKSARARLDTLDREELPYILPGGIGLDGADRTIVVGPSNDSVAVDFFQGSAFLHREMIDCFSPGKVSVGHERIALHCRDRGDAPGYRLKVWRIK